MNNNIDIIIASDVSTRDGIGIELYKDGKLILEIFRDDTEKTRKITTFTKDIPLEFMEIGIDAFRKNIPWDFIEYDKET